MTPSASTALTAITNARAFLDDNTAVTWSDSRLFAFLQIAHQELSAKLLANGVGVVQQQSATIVVPALNISLGQTGPIAIPNLPSNLIIPLELLENNVNDDVEDFESMQQVSFLPDLDPTDYLIYWAWQGQNVMVIGATCDKNVQVRYRAGLTTPQTINDSLSFIYAEMFLGPRIASLARPDRKDFSVTAFKNLETVLTYNVTADQGLPKRRVGYRRSGPLRRLY